MKNKKKNEYVPLRRVASMRVISEEVEVALKSMRDLLNDRPELAPLILDIVKLVAREGNLDFLTNAQDDLPLRVAVLQQHVKDLQKAMEELGQSATQQQDNQTNENAVIAKKFSKFWAGKGRGRRLMREGEDLMHELFARGMSDGKISELSTMTLRMVKMRREKWKALRTTRAQSNVQKNHDHSQRTLTTPDSGVTSDDVGTT